MCSFICTPKPSTDIYTLSLHDALPIFLEGLKGDAKPLGRKLLEAALARRVIAYMELGDIDKATDALLKLDRKSTRLNSSHGYISYAVFCLKKKICESWQTAPSCSCRTS